MAASSCASASVSLACALVLASSARSIAAGMGLAAELAEARASSAPFSIASALFLAPSASRCALARRADFRCQPGGDRSGLFRGPRGGFGFRRLVGRDRLQRDEALWRNGGRRNIGLGRAQPHRLLLRGGGLAGSRHLLAERPRLEQGRMHDVGGRHVGGHDDHAHPHRRHLEQALGEPERHADAAVRGGVPRQGASVQRDPRPGDALHERHRGIVVEVGVVLRLFLDDAVNSRRRLVSGLPGGDRRAQDAALGVVDRHPLLPDGDDRHQRHARGPGQHAVIPLGFSVPIAPGRRRRRIGRSRDQQSRKASGGKAGKPPLRGGGDHGGDLGMARLLGTLCHCILGHRLFTKRNLNAGYRALGSPQVRHLYVDLGRMREGPLLRPAWIEQRRQPSRPAASEPPSAPHPAAK